MFKRFFTSSAKAKFAMPYGPEDYQTLGNVFVKHDAVPKLAGLAGLIGSALVVANQWGISIQLTKLQTELTNELKKEVTSAISVEISKLKTELKVQGKM